jgi:hypothetical protein
MRTLKVMVVDLQEVMKRGPDPFSESKADKKINQVYTVAVLPETTVMYQANQGQALIFFIEEENLRVQ